MMGIPTATLSPVIWGLQAHEASVQVRSWDRAMQVRPDKTETLLPRVLPPGGSWWLTCILTDIIYSFCRCLSPALGQRSRSRLHICPSWSWLGFLLRPCSPVRSLSLSILLSKGMGSMPRQPGAFRLQKPANLTPTLQHSP